LGIAGSVVEDGMAVSENNIDLRKLPKWLQYVIALSVVAVVVAVAWLVAGDRGAPEWVTRYLAPVLGVLYLVLLAVAIVRRVRRKG
jgi:hypothetical protein